MNKQVFNIKGGKATEGKRRENKTIGPIYSIYFLNFIFFLLLREYYFKDKKS
ncbi:unnamed protein product [Meloidogyne enterolobii]|uniref:Uncharacterized protein n=1 Tax=Meloidogyne enterolobii TaxID=390850 RepID=A0ACB0Y4Q6_MELEN